MNIPILTSGIITLGIPLIYSLTKNNILEFTHVFKNNPSSNDITLCNLILLHKYYSNSIIQL